MPNYIGSTYEFARSNLTDIFGIKEANIELRKTDHLPDGVVVSAGQIVSQTPEVSSTVDINRTRIVLTVYEPKVTASSSTKASSSSETSSSSSSERSDTETSSSSSSTDTD